MVKQLVEVENEGLVSFIGRKILIFAANYIYAGELIGVNDTCVKLENAGICYETGAFTDKAYKDFQRIGDVYIMLNAIESWSEGK